MLAFKKFAIFFISLFESSIIKYFHNRERERSQFIVDGLIIIFEDEPWSSSLLRGTASLHLMSTKMFLSKRVGIL